MDKQTDIEYLDEGTMSWDPVWILRIIMAVVFLFHGWNKSLAGFSQAFGLSKTVAGLVIFAEIAGGIGYLLGGYDSSLYFGQTLTQWSSIAVTLVLLGAIYMVHWKNGFSFMNNGYEYQLTLVAVALFLYFNEITRDNDDDINNKV